MTGRKQKKCVNKEKKLEINWLAFCVIIEQKDFETPLLLQLLFNDPVNTDVQVDWSSGENMQHVYWFDLSKKTNWGKKKHLLDKACESAEKNYIKWKEK